MSHRCSDGEWRAQVIRREFDVSHRTARGPASFFRMACEPRGPALSHGPVRLFTRHLLQINLILSTILPDEASLSFPPNMVWSRPVGCSGCSIRVGSSSCCFFRPWRPDGRPPCRARPHASPSANDRYQSLPRSRGWPVRPLIRCQ